MGRPAGKITALCIHPGTAVMSGSPDVIIERQRAAREGDLTVPCGPVCKVPKPGAIAKGSSTVFVNTRMASRVGDPVACGAGATAPPRGGPAHPLPRYEVRPEDDYVAAVFGDDSFLIDEPVSRSEPDSTELDTQPERPPARFLDGLSLDVDLGGASSTQRSGAGPNAIATGATTVLIGG